MERYDPIQDMKRQDQERDRLSYTLMEQERAERKRLDAISHVLMGKTIEQERWRDTVTLRDRMERAKR